jgi:hypothetical protein
MSKRYAHQNTESQGAQKTEAGGRRTSFFHLSFSVAFWTDAHPAFMQRHGHPAIRTNLWRSDPLKQKKGFPPGKGEILFVSSFSLNSFVHPDITSLGAKV